MKKESTLIYQKRLIDKLGNPAEWEYTGVCSDRGQADGECTCGHSIRFEFHIKHPKTSKTAIVGSTCIENIQGINQQVIDGIEKDLRAMQAQIQKDKQMAKRLIQEKEIKTLSERYSKLFETLKEKVRVCREERRWVPYELYDLMCSTRGLKKEAPEFTRYASYLTWYSKSIAKAETFLLEENHNKA